MSRDHKTKIWILAVLVLSTLLLAPIFLSSPRVVEGQDGGDAWRNIIYDFQTLFTGILAIAAASFTIIQSRIIDDRQQTRHNDLLEIQIRPDKLRVERAYEVFDRIRKFGVYVVSWEAPDSIQRGDFPSDAEFNELQYFSRVCARIAVELASDELVAIKDLFDGSLYKAYQDFTETHQRFSKYVKRLLVKDDDPIDVEIGAGIITSFPMNSEMRKSAVSAAEFQLERLKDNYSAFVVNFERMAKIYKL